MKESDILRAAYALLTKSNCSSVDIERSRTLIELARQFANYRDRSDEPTSIAIEEPKEGHTNLTERARYKLYESLARNNIKEASRVYTVDKRG